MAVLKFILVVLLTNLLTQAVAQPVCYFRNLNVTDGLTSNFVTTMHEDNRGFIWVGTKDGLARFDGVSFVPFLHNSTKQNSLGHNHIGWSIKEDDQSRLWIALYNRGFSRYDPQIDGFVTFSFANGKLPEKWADKIQSFMFDADGNTYINCVDGILKVDTADNITVLAYLRADSILSDVGELRNAGLQDDRWIWMTSTKGIVCYDLLKNEWEFERNNPRKLTCFNQHMVIHNGVYHEEKLWYSEFYIPNGSKYRYLYSFDVSLNQLDSVIIAPELSGSNPYSNLLNDIIVQQDGLVLLATDGLGLLSYSPKTQIWTQYSGSSNWNGNLPSVSVNVLFEDRSQNLWIGTDRGLSLMASERQYFTNYPQVPNQTGESISLSGIRNMCIGLQDDIWLGKLSHGLLRLNSEKKIIQQIAALDSSENESRDYIDPLLVVSDTLLCHVWYGGLRTFNLKDQKVFPINTYTDENQPELRGAIQTSNNQVFAWGWNRFGKLNLSDGQFNFLKTWEENDRSDVVLGASEDSDGNIWLGMAKSGLVCIDPQNLKVLDEWKRDSNMYPTTSVTDLVVKKGKVYFSFDDDGLGIFDIESKKLNVFSKSDGLCSDAINGLILDAQGQVWIYSSSGISWFDEEHERFRTFTESDGMISQNISDASLLSNGNLILISDQGLIEFEPKMLKGIGTDRKPTLLSIQVYNRDINVLNQQLKKTVVQIPHNRNHLRVEFSAMEFFDPEKIKFAFRLEGVEENWNYTNAQPVVIYTNLKGGNYNLCAKQTNVDGIWGPELCIPMFVTTPIYLQVWFILLMVMALLTIAYWVYRWQLKKRLAVVTLRNRVSQDLHDDMGSTLSSINIFSTVAQEQLGSKDPETKVLLKQISAGAEEMMQNMDDIVWAINPNNDQLSTLQSRMLEYAVPILEAKGIEIETDIQLPKSNVSLSMEKRKNLFLIFKEAINNVAKHSQAGCAWIKIATHGNYLTLAIKDNGIGFNLSVPTNRNGLRNMNGRATEIDGQLEIKSQPGSGTELSIMVAVP